MHLDRDAGTRMAYASIATWAFFLYFVGPVTPLVAAQWGVSSQLAGLIGMALAGGLITVGLLGAPLVTRWGRQGSGIRAAVLLAGAAGVLVVAPAFPFVLLGVYLGACAGALLMNVATAALADRHGSAGPRALTEANAAAAWIGLLSPLLLGLAIGTGFGWRVVAAVVAVVAVPLGIVLSRVPLVESSHRHRVMDVADTAFEVDEPTSTSTGPAMRRPLPRLFLVSLAAIVSAVGTEVALNFWGAVLLSARTGADLAMTTAALSVLIAGIAVGRTVGASLTRRFAVAPLIYVSLALAGAGFLIVWVSPWLAAGIGGLFVTGLGFALLFPLTSSLALSHAGGQTDRAMAIIAVVIGATMGAAPFLLGAVAGTVGVTAGFVIVPVLLLVGAAAVRVATRIGRDSATPIATRLPL